MTKIRPSIRILWWIGARSKTKFGSDDCMEEIRRHSKRAWWKSSGPQFREKRKERKSTADSRSSILAVGKLGNTQNLNVRPSAFQWVCARARFP